MPTERRLLVSLGAVVVGLALAFGQASCSRVPALSVLTAGGAGAPTLVLLHGFGSSAEDWLPFAQTMAWPPPGGFVFPQAPDARAPRGPLGGRAWWPLDLGPRSRVLPDLSRTRPAGLQGASDAVVALLDQLSRTRGGPIVLGGFSQGAMVASEVAYRTTTPLAGLVLLSGTPVDEDSWRSGYAGRRKVPTFIAHGRHDDVLPFQGSDRMQRELSAAGARVTWVPFDGGHEIPEVVVVALNRFLTDLRTTF